MENLNPHETFYIYLANMVNIMLAITEKILTTLLYIKKSIG